MMSLCGKGQSDDAREAEIINALVRFQIQSARLRAGA